LALLIRILTQRGIPLGIAPYSGLTISCLSWRDLYQRLNAILIRGKTMKKLFLVLLLLSFSVCAQVSHALTYTPWWMIQGSADAAGVASFGVPVVASGSLTLSNSPAYVKMLTSDGVDTSYLNINGGGGANSTRGAGILLYGNEYPGTSFPGDMWFIAGTSATTATASKIVFQTSDTRRFQINRDGTASFSELIHFAKGAAAGTGYSFTDGSDSPVTLADAYEIVQSMETTLEGHIDHDKLSPLAYGCDYKQEPTGNFVEKTAVVPISKERQLAETPAGEEPKTEEIQTVMEPEMREVKVPNKKYRNMGMCISASALVIQDLNKKLSEMDARIKALEAK
jgi:hypothetical protein